MSNQHDPFSNLENINFIKKVDQLNLPMIQKHHVRILAHCLIVLKSISSDFMTYQETEYCLKKWCKKETQVFNDGNFSQIFYEQLALSAKKLGAYAKKVGKNINDLNIEDLVLLVRESINPIN